VNKVTVILERARQYPKTAEELLPLVYEELRRVATVKDGSRAGGLRLVGEKEGHRWDSRAHFFSAAAEAMRRILIESARHKIRLANGIRFVTVTNGVPHRFFHFHRP
jgi:hypothetical protein